MNGNTAIRCWCSMREEKTMNKTQNVASLIIRRLLIAFMTPLGLTVGFGISFFIMSTITPTIIIWFGGARSLPIIAFEIILLVIASTTLIKAFKKLRSLPVEKVLEPLAPLGGYIKTCFKFGFLGGICLFSMYLLSGTISSLLNSP